MDSFSIVLIAEGEDFDLLGHHESGIEAQTEVADDGFGFVLVLIDKFLCARESDFVDELVHFFGRHTDTTVADGKGFLVLIDEDADGEVTEFAFEIADRSECFELLRSIHGVTNQLTEKNLVVGV